MQIIGLIFAQLTLTGYLTLAESGLSDADESIAWLLPFSYPGPEDIVQKDEMDQKEAEKVGQEETDKSTPAAVTPKPGNPEIKVG
ncbi:unnamed protein product [Strongylus vulgaris]|uniref:Uncharacterized protein n=1 Tax=Strongylus vulgaris TaxID=40348 RepID=A0A3P7J962_STRVU|nr:unnamed protein product [Strongylus vulgaris]